MKTKQADYTSRGIPVVPLGAKLEYLSACILNGSYEDALGHLDDLRNSIQLRACLRGVRMDDLTPEGLKLLRYTEPTHTA